MRDSMRTRTASRPERVDWEVSTSPTKLRFVGEGTSRSADSEDSTVPANSKWGGAKRPAVGGALATGHSSDRVATKPMPRKIHRDDSVKPVSFDEVPEGPNLVRPAQNVSTQDPFSDPFGDKKPKVAEPDLVAPPSAPSLPPTRPAPQPEMDDAPVPAPAVADPVPEVDPEAPPAPPAPSAPRPLDPMPSLDPSDEPPMLPSIDPLGPFEEGKSDVPCKRIYNERNCCAEDEKCERARKYLKSHQLRDISLDITPSFKPDAKTKEEVEQHKAQKLAAIPARTWKNRAGEVVADGKMRDFALGRVIVEGEGGQIQKVPLIDLGDDDRCFVTAWWGIPSECMLDDTAPVNRLWVPVEMQWKASDLCHKPLYFEEVQLERYGHTTGPFMEPIVSGAHFFLNVAVLPYKMGINPPGECQYVLGYYRPGSCAPWLVPPMPVSVRGALLEAGAIVGGVLVIP